LPSLGQRYRQPSDLPGQLAVFPLQRAILLPRANLPLNIFEPRYLAMLDEVISTTRVLAIVQPTPSEEESPAGKSVALRSVGCAGRVSAYQERDDGRLLIALSGIARCELRGEAATDKPYRVFSVSYDRFTMDFETGAGEDLVDREAVVRTLKKYLEARNMDADWDSVLKASTEVLVNSLAIASPYGPEEKQALLEAADLKTRAEVLVALAEMELAAGAAGSGSALQ
jgi:uncharacterized protein